MQGFAFVFTYVLLSVPIGRLVDKFNRINIMISGVIVWSITTFTCGLSRNFYELFFARMGVGAGEAALSPAAWSVLADYFRPERLSFPISIYIVSHLPDAQVFKVKSKYIIYTIIFLSFFSLFFWIKFANHSYCWLPYQNYFLY